MCSIVSWDLLQMRQCGSLPSLMMWWWYTLVDRVWSWVAMIRPSVSALRPVDLSHWFVVFISTSASLIHWGYFPCNAFSSYLVCTCWRPWYFTAVLILLHTLPSGYGSISLRSNSFLNLAASFGIEKSFFLFSCCWTKWRRELFVDVKYAARLIISGSLVSQFHLGKASSSFRPRKVESVHIFFGVVHFIQGK